MHYFPVPASQLARSPQKRARCAFLSARCLALQNYPSTRCQPGHKKLSRLLHFKACHKMPVLVLIQQCLFLLTVLCVLPAVSDSELEVIRFFLSKSFLNK